jgi:glycosyltransferase involved in cell wall biosynthesis
VVAPNHSRPSVRQADLVLFPGTVLGGAEKVLRIIAEAVARRGKHVILLFLTSHGRPWEQLPDGIETVNLGLPREKLGLIALPFVLRSLQRRYTIDRVFTSHVHLNAAIAFWRRRGLLRCQSHVMRESTVIGERFRGLRLMTFRQHYRAYGTPDLLICQTRYMRDRLHELVPRSARWNVLVNPNPFDAGRVLITGAYSDTALDDLRPYVLTVGRLIHTKGHDVLIRAFALVSKRVAGMNLVIAGDGPELRALQSLAEHLAVAERVRFTGRVENPFPLMRAARLGVIASRKEGFPNTLLEMMHCCDRVVSTRCAGEIDELPGIYHCAPDRVDELADAIEKALTCPVGDRASRMQAEVGCRTPDTYLQAIEVALTSSQPRFSMRSSLGAREIPSERSVGTLSNMSGDVEHASSVPDRE